MSPNKRTTLFAKLAISLLASILSILDTVWTSESLAAAYGRLVSCSHDFQLQEMLSEYTKFTIRLQIDNFLLDMCKAATGSLLEAYAAGFLLARMQSTAQGLVSPEVICTEFNLRRVEFVRLCSLVLFSIPVDVISVGVHVFRLLSFQFSRIVIVLFCFLAALYCLLNVLFGMLRNRLRKRTLDHTTDKNEFCRYALNNYESCRAEETETAKTCEFLQKLALISSSQIAFHFQSELGRLIARSLFLFGKAFPVILALCRVNVPAVEMYYRINETGKKIIALRNSFLRSMEHYHLYSNGSCTNKVNKNETGQVNDENNASDLVNLDKCQIRRTAGCFGDEFSFSDGNIAFSIGLHRKTLIVAPSGCGKSSIISLLMSPIGPDIQVSLQPQQQCIFAKSVRMNLQYGNSLSPEMLLARLKQLGFGSFASLLDTPAGSISSGQKQLLCILRCMLKDASVHIFDEPSYFLDEQNIVNVYRAMSSLDTVIVVSKSCKHSEMFDDVIDLCKCSGNWKMSASMP